LVIHNAPFDLGFLNHELQRMGVEQTIEDNCTIIDSLEISKQQRISFVLGYLCMIL
jgi:DNA polymerase-3 subunit epsilon